MKKKNSKSYTYFVSYYWKKGGFNGFGQTSVAVNCKSLNTNDVHEIQRLVSKKNSFDNTILLTIMRLKQHKH